MPYHHYHPRGLKKVIMEMAHSFKHTLVDSVNNISARSLYTCCPSHVTHFCLTHTHTHQIDALHLSKGNGLLSQCDEVNFFNKQKQFADMSELHFMYTTI